MAVPCSAANAKRRRLRPRAPGLRLARRRRRHTRDQRGHQAPCAAYEPRVVKRRWNKSTRDLDDFGWFGSFGWSFVGEIEVALWENQTWQWEIHGNPLEMEFLDGKIIHKWWIFQQAVFDYRRIALGFASGSSGKRDEFACGKGCWDDLWWC